MTAQNLVAMNKANTVKFAMADWKRPVEKMSRSDGLAYVADWLEESREPDNPLNRLGVTAIFQAIRGVGPTAAREAMRLADIRRFDAHVGDITPRQIEALAEFCRDAMCRRGREDWRPSVSNEPFRKRFELMRMADPTLTAAVIASRLGWLQRGRPDGNRVRITLGLAPYTARGGARSSVKSVVHYRTAVALMDALDMDPHEAGI